MISKPNSCHDCLRNFIFNGKLMVRLHISFFSGACLSKIPVQIVISVSVLVSEVHALMNLRKLLYESPYISDN